MNDGLRLPAVGEAGARSGARAERRGRRRSRLEIFIGAIFSSSSSTPSSTSLDGTGFFGCCSGVLVRDCSSCLLMIALVSEKVEMGSRIAVTPGMTLIGAMRASSSSTESSTASASLPVALANAGLLLGGQLDPELSPWRSTSGAPGVGLRVGVPPTDWETNLPGYRENIVIAYLPFRESPVRSAGSSPRTVRARLHPQPVRYAPLLATGEGRPVVPALGAKPLALLAYLVLERRPHSREALAGPALGRVARGRGACLPPPGAQAPAGRARRRAPGRAGAGRARRTARLRRRSSSGRRLEQRPRPRGRPSTSPGSSKGSRSAGRRSSTSGSPPPAASLLRQYHQALGRAAREAMAPVALARGRGAGRPVAARAIRCPTRRPSWPSRRATSRATAPARWRGTPSTGTSWPARPGASPSRALEALVRRVEADRTTPERRRSPTSGTPALRPSRRAWSGATPSGRR